MSSAPPAKAIRALMGLDQHRWTSVFAWITWRRSAMAPVPALRATSLPMMMMSAATPVLLATTRVRLATQCVNAVLVDRAPAKTVQRTLTHASARRDTSRRRKVTMQARMDAQAAPGTPTALLQAQLSARLTCHKASGEHPIRRWGYGVATISKPALGEPLRRNHAPKGTKDPFAGLAWMDLL